MDHDQRLKLLVQALFSHLIRLVLPGWWDRFRFDAVEWLQQEVFLDPPQGETGAIDLAAKVKLNRPVPMGRANHLETLVLVEIEARDRAATLREKIFDYRDVLRVRYGLPVLPVAVFLGVGLEGIGWDEYVEDYWEEQIERCRFAYVGLPRLDADAQVQGDNLFAVALTGLMAAPDDQRARIKADAMQKAATCGENDYVRTLMCECIDAYTQLHPPHLAEYLGLLATPKYKEAGMAMMTTREEGEKVGKVKGKIEVLEILLAERFGALAPSVQERLETRTREQLDELTRKLLTAQSLRELGLEP